MTSSNDLVEAAFKTAIRDFKATLKDEKLLEDISKTKSIEDVYDATDALQKEQGKKGRLHHLAKIQPYLECLRSYTSVIEIFIQSKQDVLALIWGPIKLLLHWTNEMKQSFDAVLDTLADIALLLPDFQEARKLFSHNEHIKDVLVLFFRDILDFYLIVLKFFRKSFFKHIFDSMWTKQREKINVVRTQIQRHAQLLNRDVRLEHIQEAHTALLQARDHYEKTEKSFRRQEYQAIKISVSPTTYEDELYLLGTRVCQGTGRWLLRDATFVRWLDKTDDSTRILWLQGIPGAGKTYLSTTVIHKAREVEQTRTIYAFLSYKTSSNSSALSILHSLIFQLTSDNDDLQEVLCQTGNENLKGSFSTAVDLLKSLLGCVGTTYIVIDGVDEAQESERHRFLTKILEISKVCEKTKILISSRAEADIAEVLKDQLSIRVDSRNAGSIQTFVNRRTETWFDEFQVLPEARVEIQGLLAPLASIAKGMFLYANVVLSSMESLESIEEIRKELRVLPEDLGAAYARILDRINSLESASQKNKIRKILGWVGCAPTPLTIHEIEQALVVSGEGADGNAKVIRKLNIPKICGPIVEVVGECDYIQFVHFTVKEYLFSSSVDGSLDLTEATLSLALCCVTYLCQIHHDLDVLEEDIVGHILSGAYRLDDFAASTWIELVERYIRLMGRNALSEELVDGLEVLRCERTNELYQDSTESGPLLHLEPLKAVSPALQDMLRQAICFREASMKGSFNKSQGSSWAHLDPLTVSASSVRMYQEFNNLQCRESRHDTFQYAEIEWHYGKRPFKCGFLDCAFRRDGFKSKSHQHSHMKHHDRPWKCIVEGCEYAEIGFLSRRMRDNHHQVHAPSERQQLSNGEDLEEEDLQPLLFDLIKADKVDAVRDLQEKLKALPFTVEHSLRECAASCGSTAMIDCVSPFDKAKFPTDELIWSIRASNTAVFKHLLSRSKDCRRISRSANCMLILNTVLTSESEECFEEWEKYFNIDLIECSPSDRKAFFPAWASSSAIKATERHAVKENRLISIWEKLISFGALSSRSLNEGLSAAAQFSSLRLAKFLVDHGAVVDFRSSDHYLTPLHHTARQTSAAGAEMMKYLLLQGADPASESGRAKLKIHDEKGAKGISRHLGMSWDELVAYAAKERVKMAEQSQESA